jgi:hypothetical protein
VKPRQAAMAQAIAQRVRWLLWAEWLSVVCTKMKG